MTRLDAYEPLSEAEQKFIGEADMPERTSVGDGALPIEDDPDRVIRAGLIRLVLLDRSRGVDLHDKGVRLRGALISGSLDLQGCDLSRDISLSHCRLTGPLSICLLYTSPSPRDQRGSRMPSSA